MKMQWFINIIMKMVAALGYTTLAEVLAAIQGTRFLAYRHDSTQTIPSGVTRRVALNDVIFDTKSEWYQAGERLDIAQDGHYQISFSIGYRPTIGVDCIFQARLMIDGDFKSISMVHSSHSNFICACNSILLHLNAGDMLWLAAEHNSGFDVNLDYTANMTYLSVERVP